MKTSQFSLVLTIWMCALSCVAQTQTSATPKAQYAVDSKVALDRYEGDKKLCNDESSSTARLQCRRDALAAVPYPQHQLAGARLQADGKWRPAIAARIFQQVG